MRAGWKPDPAKRHQNRYYDGMWTDQVSDDGVKSTDPEGGYTFVPPPPRVRTPEQKHRDRIVMWCVFGACAVAVAVVIVASLLGNDDTEVDRGDAFGAQSVCEQSVEAKLKAPGSADFQSDPTVGRAGRGWVVVGYVDSENSFGANIRVSYTCDARYVDDDRWSVDSTLLE